MKGEEDAVAGEVWQEDDGVLLLCIVPGLRWRDWRGADVPWDEPTIARPVRLLLDEWGKLVVEDSRLADAWDQGLIAAGESIKAIYDGSGSWTKPVNPYRGEAEERNPYLPEAPEDGKHIFIDNSYRCSRCGVYNRTDSPPFHEPCKGQWAGEDACGGGGAMGR